MEYLWLAFAGGAVAFGHCLGMCGGFALHLSRGPSFAGVLGRQLLWHAGRGATYVFLGALAGSFGAFIQGSLPVIQNYAAYVAGGLMTLMGLGLMGLLPRLRRRKADGEEGLFAGLFKQFFADPSPTGALVLGVATGFLPCPIVLALLAVAAGSGSVLSGMLVMAAMGLGTVWALLLLGLTGRMVTLRLRRWGAVIAGVVLLATGAATMARGTEAFHAMLGCHCHEGGASGGGCCGGATTPAAGACCADAAGKSHCRCCCGQGSQPADCACCCCRAATAGTTCPCHENPTHPAPASAQAAGSCGTASQPAAGGGG